MIDYSIAKRMRKRGYGVELLKKLEETLQENGYGITVLMAQVKKENKASVKAFQRCGYAQKPKE